jgi:cytidine deaminase
MDEIKITSKFTVFSNSDELSLSEKELFSQAVDARKNAYAPYSQFNVGTSILLANGQIFQGNNQENAAYPSGMCAERVAIWNASSQFPNIPIKKIFISANTKNKSLDRPVPPCGACRQTIVEYESKQKENIEIFFTGETGNIIKADSISELLPLAFDKSLL